jgi:hypothetical protein
MRIQIRDLVNPVSAMEKIRIRDKHSGSAPLHPAMKKESKTAIKTTQFFAFPLLGLFLPTGIGSSRKNQCRYGSTTLLSS